MNFRDLHQIFIGYNRVDAYAFQMDVIRENWPNGKDIWISTIYNGKNNWLVPGVFGENNFIKLDDNNGYGYGALDSFNAGLEFAMKHNRDIICLSNFDSGFLTQKGMEKILDEFVKSDCAFCAGEDIHGIPVTDGIIIKRDVIEKLLPILPEAHPDRMLDSELIKEYESTSLGFQNMEEIFYNAIIKAGLQDSWMKMHRGDLPRLRFSTENSFWHIHDPSELKTLCVQYDIAHGIRVQRLLASDDLSYFEQNVVDNPNKV